MEAGRGRQAAREFANARVFQAIILELFARAAGSVFATGQRPTKSAHLSIMRTILSLAVASWAKWQMFDLL
jgi:hypothetical protein